MARTRRDGARPGRRSGSANGQRRPSVHHHAHDADSYASLSMTPLHVLAFLLPFIALYEVCSAITLHSADAGGQAAQMIRAEAMVLWFFQLFGLGSLYLPGIVLLVVLLVWHVLSGRSWKVHPEVLGWMFLESICWTLPLIVLAQIVYSLALGDAALGATGALVMAGSQGGATDLSQLPLVSRVAVALGAGIYEELVFRLVAIALLHLILWDLVKMKEPGAKIVSVVIAAVLFGLYHDVASSSGAFDVPRFLTIVVAGLYFGGLYVWRGFGIVVATHALYDLVLLVLL